MSARDVVCRAALFPKFMSSDVFSPETFLQFRLVDGSRNYATSVASRHMLADAEGAHSYGVTAADIANARQVELKGRPLDSNEKVYYLGFYDLFYGEILSIRPEFYRMAVVGCPEHGNNAHCQIELHHIEVEATKNQRKGDRVAAVSALADCLNGPNLHDFAFDLETTAMLAGIELPERKSASGYD